MPGILGGLPPGLRGYVAAEDRAERRGANTLNQATGIFGLRNQMEMAPLQQEMLRIQLEQARRNMALRSGILGGGAPTTPDQALTQGAAVGDIGPTSTNAARIGQVPQGSAGGYGMSPQLQAMLLSGDPGMTALAKAQLEQQKPVVGREGAPILERQPDGSYRVAFSSVKSEPGVQIEYGPGGATGAREIPGYGGIVAGMAGRTTAAQEAAKAPYQPPIETIGGQGERILTPRPAYAAPWLNQGQSVPRAAAGGALASPDAPPRPAVPLARGDRGPTPAATAEAVEVARERAGAGVKYETTILESGQKARNSLTNLQILYPDLTKLPTGPLYPTMVNAAAYFSQFGINVGQLTQQLGPAQASDAILKQLALKLRNPAGGEGMPGQLSNQDRQFLVDAIPGLGKVPDGNRKLLDIMMKLEQRKIDEAAIVSRMQGDKKSTGEIRSALTQFANNRPMFAR